MTGRPMPQHHAETLERERRRELLVALEVIAGDRCPCGHSNADHRPARSNLGVPSGLRKMLGACLVCDCRGLLEPDDDGDGAA